MKTDFTKYELKLLQEALVNYQADYELEMERGASGSPAFVRSMNLLGAKLDLLLSEEDTDE